MGLCLWIRRGGGRQGSKGGSEGRIGSWMDVCKAVQSGQSKRATGLGQSSVSIETLFRHTREIIRSGIVRTKSIRAVMAIANFD